jgi:hypothetical protein
MNLKYYRMTNKANKTHAADGMGGGGARKTISLFELPLPAADAQAFGGIGLLDVTKEGGENEDALLVLFFGMGINYFCRECSWWDDPVAPWRSESRV